MSALYDLPQLACLFDPARRAVFERVARKPAKAHELVDELGFSPLEITRHIRDLIDVGLVRSEGSGTRVHYRVDCGAMASMDRALDAAWMRSIALHMARV